MEALLTAEGETVPRPEYDAGADAAMKREDDAVKDEDDEGEEEGKKNYESTSEEE